MEHNVIHESDAFTVIDCRKDTGIPLRNTRATQIFLKNDWNWAASGVGPRRTADRLSKLHAKIRITVLMHEVDNHRQGAALFESLVMAGQWKMSQEHVNVVLTNNISTPNAHIPLTPWMSLHRIVHCVHANGLEIPGKGFFQCLATAFNNAGGHGSFHNLGWEVDGEFDHFLRLILTTRCAREGKISSNLDFAGELFAQHFMGGVKFLRVKDWDERLAMLRSSERTMHSQRVVDKMRANPVETDNLLAALENLVAEDVALMTAAMTGKIFRF